MALTTQFLATKLTPSSCNTFTFFSNSHIHHQNSIKFDPKTRFNLHCCSSNKQPLQLLQFLEGFSLLDSEPPTWESNNVWSTMALYFFSLHVPLSFGGLSLIANLLQQPVLDPQLKAVAILVLGSSELFAAVLLLRLTAKPAYKSVNFLERNLQTERNWIFSAVVGFGVLVAAMYITSALAGILVRDEGVNNQTVKEILQSGIVGQTSISLVYCVIAPILEEIVYRRFLLASLVPSMKWPKALVVSSIIFAAVHLSGSTFIQLFIVGLVLGCSYSWTGDLRSSILLHSMYNALTLFIVFYG